MATALADQLKNTNVGYAVTYLNFSRTPSHILQGKSPSGLRLAGQAEETGQR